MNIKHDITSALTVSFLTIAAGAAFGIWTGVGVGAYFRDFDGYKIAFNHFG